MAGISVSLGSVAFADDWKCHDVCDVREMVTLSVTSYKDCKMQLFDDDNSVADCCIYGFRCVINYLCALT